MAFLQLTAAEPLVLSPTADTRFSPMTRQNLVAAVLVVLVSIPGFLLGHQLQAGAGSVPLMAALLCAVVLLAGAIMKQLD